MHVLSPVVGYISDISIYDLNETVYNIVVDLYELNVCTKSVKVRTRESSKVMCKCVRLWRERQLLLLSM